MSEPSTLSSAAPGVPTAPAAPGESPLRLVLTPALTGLLAGLALAGVWTMTAPRIEANRQARLEASVREVLPGAETTLGLARDDEGRFAAVESQGRPEVWVGFGSSGELIGWAIPTEGMGYQDTIRVLYGLDPSLRRTLGMVVLESRETPGLGDRIYKDPDFVETFRSLATDPPPALVQGTATAPHEVEAITGATISSKAVVRMIAESLSEWSPVLDGAEPPSIPEPASGEASPSRASSPASPAPASGRPGASPGDVPPGTGGDRP